MSRGQAVIVGIFGVSLLAAGSSMWFRYVQTREVLEFWGADAVSLITDPERVELWRLEPAGDQSPSGEAVSRAAADGNTVDGNTVDGNTVDGNTADEITVDGIAYGVAMTRIVTKAPGFTNARHALTVQRSFQWDAPTCGPTWSHALVFSRDDRRATVVFSLDKECPLAKLADGDKAVGIAPIVEGLVTAFDEQLGSQD